MVDLTVAPLSNLAVSLFLPDRHMIKLNERSGPQEIIELRPYGLEFHDQFVLFGICKTIGLEGRAAKRFRATVLTALLDLRCFTNSTILDQSGVLIKGKS
jgi:hypothetical protein